MPFKFFSKKDDSYYQKLEERYKEDKKDLKAEYDKKIQKLQEELKQKLAKLKADFKKKLGDERLLQRQNKKIGERDTNIVKFITLLIENKLLNETNDKDLIKMLGKQMREKNIDGALYFLETKFNGEQLDEKIKNNLINILNTINGSSTQKFLSKNKIEFDKILKGIQFKKIEKFKNKILKQVENNNNYNKMFEAEFSSLRCIEQLSLGKVFGGTVPVVYSVDDLSMNMIICQQIFMFYINLRGLGEKYKENDDLKTLLKKVNDISKKQCDSVGINENNDGAIDSLSEISEKYAKTIKLSQLILSVNRFIENISKLN